MSKKAFRVRFEDELYEDIKHVAELDECTPTKVIRDAVQSYVIVRKAQSHARAVFKNP